jgi:hypothetical protein
MDLAISRLNQYVAKRQQTCKGYKAEGRDGYAVEIYNQVEASVLQSSASGVAGGGLWISATSQNGD